MFDESLPLINSTDFGRINSISLLVGTACNMGCRHCSQRPVRSLGSSNFSIPSLVYNFLCNFLKFSVSTYKGHGFKNQFIFWGGEPLLYWDSIKETILRFEKDLQIQSGDGFEFALTTNGTLLTEEMVSFINEQKIKVGFSYEAPNPSVVRGSVLESVCNLIRKIDNFTISACCGTKYNCDPLLAYLCLSAKFPEAKSFDVFDRLTFSFLMPSDIYDYDWDLIRSNYKKLRIAAQLGNKFALDKFYGYFNKMNAVKVLSQSMPAPLRVLRCAYCDSEITVSLDGKISYCSNGDMFFSTLFDSWRTYHDRNIAYANKISSPYCAACRHNDFCLKQCSLNIKDDNGMFLNCEKQLIPLYDIIKSEIFELSRSVTKEEVSWYHLQEKLMDEQVQSFLSQ